MAISNINDALIITVIIILYYYSLLIILVASSKNRSTGVRLNLPKRQYFCHFYEVDTMRLLSLFGLAFGPPGLREKILRNFSPKLKVFQFLLTIVIWQ